MGDIAPTVRTSLEPHGLRVESVEFRQNTFRDEFGYTRALKKAVEAFGPKVVFPIGNPLALSRYKSSLPAGVTAAVEDEDKITILDRKVPFSCLMSELGVRQPHFYASAEEAEGRDVIFKRDISFGGQGVHRPWNVAALKNLIAHQSPGEPYLIEDFIEGEDWSVDAVRFDDFFRAGAYKVLSANGKGPSLQRRVSEFPALTDIAHAILDHLDYKGVCGFDFRVDAAGLPYILEANPRFTGGIATQIESGFDIPYLIWKGFANDV